LTSIKQAAPVRSGKNLQEKVPTFNKEVRYHRTTYNKYEVLWPHDDILPEVVRQKRTTLFVPPLPPKTKDKNKVLELFKDKEIFLAKLVKKKRRKFDDFNDKPVIKFKDKKFKIEPVELKTSWKLPSYSKFVYKTLRELNVTYTPESVNQVFFKTGWNRPAIIIKSLVLFKESFDNRTLHGVREYLKLCLDTASRRLKMKDWKLYHPPKKVQHLLKRLWRFLQSRIITSPNSDLNPQEICSCIHNLRF